jgi:hypothetical protein
MVFYIGNNNPVQCLFNLHNLHKLEEVFLLPGGCVPHCGERLKPSFPPVNLGGEGVKERPKEAVRALLGRIVQFAQSGQAPEKGTRRRDSGRQGE